MHAHKDFGRGGKKRATSHGGAVHQDLWTPYNLLHSYEFEEMENQGRLAI